MNQREILEARCSMREQSQSTLGIHWPTEGYAGGSSVGRIDVCMLTRLVDQPFAASYPGLLTRGIASPDSYIYREIVADCLRGAEFLLDYAKVDRGRVAISGDDLALLTAGRRSGFSAIQASGLLFYRLNDARERSQAYSIEEVNDYVRAHPEHEAAVASTLAYFDPQHHVANIRGKTLLSIGDPGAIGGQEWLEPLGDAFNGPVEHYDLTHRGGTDNDWIDAWLAGELGREAMSRFRRSSV
jgi:cephalosporin-C deacetylase